MFALLVLMVLLALMAHAAARQARLNLGPDGGLGEDSRRTPPGRVEGTRPDRRWGVEAKTPLPLGEGPRAARG
ncbi:hypothetical protein [Deinococcus sp. NW-56]|uniref:hypothetical protein n=1 Tax=Deinococcus sp. NW-56 TaxID=2080419 RepID=UPI00131A23FD|nr:hypothetical protein [Deinococcus sp. NW-56]